MVRALRSMHVPDLGHSRVLHLVTLPPAVIYGTRLWSLRAAERRSGELHLPANHLPRGRHLPFSSPLSRVG